MHAEGCVAASGFQRSQLHCLLQDPNEAQPPAPTICCKASGCNPDQPANYRAPFWQARYRLDANTMKSKKEMFFPKAPACVLTSASPIDANRKRRVFCIGPTPGDVASSKHVADTRRLPACPASASFLVGEVATPTAQVRDIRRSHPGGSYNSVAVRTDVHLPKALDLASILQLDPTDAQWWSHQLHEASEGSGGELPDLQIDVGTRRRIHEARAGRLHAVKGDKTIPRCGACFAHKAASSLKQLPAKCEAVHVSTTHGNLEDLSASG
mmetsp:Transcript_100990/g.253189  ORF Transcript_100990/g.253189 Transcript_100990/m.253189 type:complete len:268 (+) Transcript_100990:90-893(+)